MQQSSCIQKKKSYNQRIKPVLQTAMQCLACQLKTLENETTLHNLWPTLRQVCWTAERRAWQNPCKSTIKALRFFRNVDVNELLHKSLNAFHACQFNDGTPTLLPRSSPLSNEQSKTEQKTTTRIPRLETHHEQTFFCFRLPTLQNSIHAHKDTILLLQYFSSVE